MNRTRLIIIGGGILIVIGLILAFVFGRKVAPEQAVKGDILIWGVSDDENVVMPLLSGFQKAYPGVKITYERKYESRYENDLLDALAAGKGPDVFYIKNTWLPKHINKLLPIPVSYMTSSGFKDIFVDVAYEDFVSEGNIYALPLFVDTLALFYNKDIFNSAGVANPPATWEGLLSMTPLLTQKDQSGNILRSALSLGTARNVKNAPDILGLLMLQSGTQMFDKEKNSATFDRSSSAGGVEYPSGQEALEFYTNFANPKKSVYTWNNFIPDSLDAFVEGKAAMMLGYSAQMEEIRAKAPHLKFAVSLMPQPKGAKQVVNYADYWGVAVSGASKYSDIAWLVAYYLTDKDANKTYLETTGRPTGRRDLIDSQRQGANKELGLFAQQSLSAYSWHQPDSGAVSKIFSDMIESTVLGTPAQTALESATNQVNLLVR